MYSKSPAGCTVGIVNYLPRTVDSALDELMSFESAIAIDGTNGAGKTATAARRATKTSRADIAAERAILEADALFADASGGTLLIDEWQRLPQVWDSVRGLVDDGADPGRFPLTGSATPRSGTDTQSGAGRIQTLRMRPMALHERGVTQSTVSLSALLEGTADKPAGETDFTAARYFEAITGSGFPDVVGLPERQSSRRPETYLRRVNDREKVGKAH